MIEEREFGASLRRERERRGIGLDEIAEQTKVSASLLAGMERGDLSRWPAGIFRRAFVRSYAAAVGLDVEATLDEFLRVFPEDGGPARPRAASGGGHSLRLTLGDATGAHLDRRRLAAASIDAAVIVCALAVGWAFGTWQMAAAASAAVAVLWHATGTIVWGTTPGMRMMRRRVPPPRAERSPAGDEVPADFEPELARPPASHAHRLRLGRRERRARAERADRAHGGESRIKRT